jgi:alpha-beta hydrolase superfamily lysophospholipase
MCGSCKVIEAYNADKKCGFIFTVNGFNTICELAHRVNKKKNLSGIPQTVPIFILSGSEDPVGNYGKSSKQLFDRYREVGLQDVTIKQYEGCRHEILNEEIRYEVYEEIYHWILSKCNQKNV